MTGSIKVNRTSNNINQSNNRRNALLLGIETGDVIGIAAGMLSEIIKKGRIRRHGLIYFG
jgi:hypothetical protein